MINFFKNLFGGKPVETVPEVPYKVETPPADTTPVVVSEQASQAVIESIAPAKKKPAAKKAPAAKKPRKPRAPKVAK
jgi:hypothetical protein